MIAKLSDNVLLRAALGLAESDSPFPWQGRLLEAFRRADMPSIVDIPTGLGKTSVMAIWLVARVLGASVPRRLVYVVDRRAVVDQATGVALTLRTFVERMPEVQERLGVAKRALAVSTLRGQFADNREWLEDPSTPAIIVGTVDMIGSRLLFQGYGVSRKMRPYHAGLLGADTLIVLDEAHLVPAFEGMLEGMAHGSEAFGSQERSLDGVVPLLRVISLSATCRSRPGSAFGLDENDLKNPVVGQRLRAPKRLVIRELANETTPLAEALAECAWALSDSGRKAMRCIVFCDKRQDAVACKEAVEKSAKASGGLGIAAAEIEVELFVGGRRVYERQEAQDRLEELGFIASVRRSVERATFLFATSAAEVGVDLDADVMVGDLVAWERMVQRLGRINRRGDVAQGSDIVVFANDGAKDPDFVAKQRLYREALELLPEREGIHDASLAALRELMLRENTDTRIGEALRKASSPMPLRPALTRALVDAWSLTSLEEDPSRPEIQPWLRGWVENDPPQTQVVWRQYLPSQFRDGKTSPAMQKAVADFFEAAPIHLSETLETETFRVADWLEARVRHLVKDQQAGEEAAPVTPAEVVAIVLSKAGSVSAQFRSGELQDFFKGKRKNELRNTLAGATLVVDRRIGGLRAGLLDSSVGEPSRTADDGLPWLSADETTKRPPVAFRIKSLDADQHLKPDPNWTERFRLAVELSEEDEPRRWLVVEKWRHDGATEDDRSSGNPQLLDEHQRWAEQRAREIAAALGLSDDYTEMLAAAACLHDEGKSTPRWQRAFNAPTDAPHAKTRGPINYRLLDGYRHELRSMAAAAENARVTALPNDKQELALHLIAAHHGNGRPSIETRSCDDAPPSALEERAERIALNFAKQQRRWGPWGLAWWEALLRAADQQASRDNDSRVNPGGGR